MSSPGSPEKWVSPPVVAVTGGIACGKSEVGRILAGAGVEVLDADDVARRMLDPGTATFDAVSRAFGPGVVSRAGVIDRPALADHVFSDPKARARLNAILHPPVINHIIAWRERQRARKRAAAALIPLLFEAGSETGWDAVICVVDREDRVLARLRERGLSEEKARLRLVAQWPLREKARRSDVVLRNDAGLHELELNTLEAWNAIAEKRRMKHA